jgi:capsid protein
MAKKNKKLKSQIKRLEKQMAKYEIAEPNDQRKAPKIERVDEAGIYPTRKRLLGINAARQLERNYSPMRAQQHQFKMNVVGTLAKIQVNDEAGGKDASKWFNEEWAASPDFKNDAIHFNQVLQNIVTSVHREGDCIVAVDDNLFKDSGKLLFWESDQICPLSESALEDSPYKGFTQDQGLIRDPITDKIVAFVVSGKRGLSTIDDYKECVILTTDEARFVSKPWRLNQGRGVGSVVTSAPQIQDVYEMQAAELQSAKANAKRAGVIKRADESADADYMIEQIEEEQVSDDVSAADALDTKDKLPNYENFEALTGGYMEYLREGDDFQLLDSNRPNVNMLAFIQSLMGQAGSSRGLAKCYTNLEASTSYTAFRGEQIMTWPTFEDDQKWIERQVCDWISKKVLTWALRKGVVSSLADGWERCISWTWPQMREVDNLKAETAVRMKLKNGTTDWSKLLGPNWKEILTKFGEQVKFIKDQGLPLSVFETVAGAIIEDDNDDEGVIVDEE